MSGGTFSKAARPERPGVYTNFEAIIPTVINPTPGQTVCVPLVHDWGPFEEAVLISNYQEFLSVYGDSDTEGLRAVRGAFKGEGLTGRGGAGAVLCYRFGKEEAAAATKSIKNAKEEEALKLTARYKGEKGNEIKITTRDEPGEGEGANDQLLVYVGTTLVETYTYKDKEVEELADAINASSEWVTAEMKKTGEALKAVTTEALTGGKDGENPTKADWTDAFAAVSTLRFGIIAPFLLNNETVGDGEASDIHTSLNTWIAEQNSTGHRCMLVVGGEAAETISTANTRSEGYDDPNVVNVGYGKYTDADDIVEETGEARVVSTAELAPRVAGILAAKGEAMSATFARLAGLELTEGPVEADILLAFDSGTTVLGADSNIDSPVRIEKALTTYTTTTDEQVPYLIYRSPKFVLTMQNLERELQEFGESDVIGQLPVNDKTRMLLVGEMKVRCQNRVERSIIQPGFTVEIDQIPPPSDDDEFIALVYGIKFGRSIEQIFNTIRVG